MKYHGKASHASAYPWEGVNALDAAVLAYNNISVLRQQLKPEWRLHGEDHAETVIALAALSSFFNRQQLPRQSHLKVCLLLSQHG